MVLVVGAVLVAELLGILHHAARVAVLVVHHGPYLGRDVGLGEVVLLVVVVDEGDDVGEFLNR